MKHFLINVTWRCQNAGVCRYCWVNQTVRERPELLHAQERPLEDWVRAINRDKPEVVDVAGGEPLLVGWIPDLMKACPDTMFGLSTNGLAYRELLALCEAHPKNLLSINMSYHPDAARRWTLYDAMYERAIKAVMAHGGRPHVNIVDAFDNVEQSERMMVWLRTLGVHAVVSPYEHMDILGQKTETGLCCQGGVNHFTVAPDGTAWPCLTTLRSPYWRETALGNWLDGTIDLRKKAQPCYLNCVDYYVLPSQHESGDMWCIEAKPCAS